MVWIDIQKDTGSGLDAEEKLQVKFYKKESHKDPDRGSYSHNEEIPREDQMRLREGPQLDPQREEFWTKIKKKVEQATRGFALPCMCQGKSPQIGQKAIGELRLNLPIITVGGLPGSGTSTFAKLLAEKLGIEYLGAGQVFRKMAADSGMDLGEFSMQAERDHEIDHKIDKMQIEMARGKDIVVDSRLCSWVIEEADLKVGLIAKFEERARRIAERDGLSKEEAIKRVSEREGSEKRRYEEIYDIDIGNMEVYDVVINSGTYSPDKIVTIVCKALETAKARPKEGKED